MLPTAVLVLAVAVSAAPIDTSQAVRNAHKDVRPALTSTHLLTTSIQGNLKSLEWDLGWWGQNKTKALASKEFTSWTAEIGEFRRASEAISAINDPFADIKEELAETEAVKAAAASVPQSISGKIEDIRILRKRYDADAARQALRRARGAAKPLKLSVNASQQAVLDAVAALRKTANGLRKRILRSLPDSKKDKTSGDRVGRKRINTRLDLIEADSDALKTEIARLELFFGLNNLLEKLE